MAVFIGLLSCLPKGFQQAARDACCFLRAGLGRGAGLVRRLVALKKTKNLAAENSEIAGSGQDVIQLQLGHGFEIGASGLSFAVVPFRFAGITSSPLIGEYGVHETSDQLAAEALGGGR
jgi:hypothetical protein